MRFRLTAAGYRGTEGTRSLVWLEVGAAARCGTASGAETMESGAASASAAVFVATTVELAVSPEVCFLVLFFLFYV